MVNDLWGMNQSFLEQSFKVSHDKEEREGSEKGEDDEVDVLDIDRCSFLDDIQDLQLLLLNVFGFTLHLCTFQN